MDELSMPPEYVEVSTLPILPPERDRQNDQCHTCFCETYNFPLICGHMLCESCYGPSICGFCRIFIKRYVCIVDYSGKRSWFSAHYGLGSITLAELLEQLPVSSVPSYQKTEFIIQGKSVSCDTRLNPYLNEEDCLFVFLRRSSRSNKYSGIF